MYLFKAQYFLIIHWTPGDKGENGVDHKFLQQPWQLVEGHLWAEWSWLRMSLFANDPREFQRKREIASSPLQQPHSGWSRTGHSWDLCRSACSSHSELSHWTTWLPRKQSNSIYGVNISTLHYLVDVRALYGDNIVALLLQQGNCFSDCPLASRGRL